MGCAYLDALVSASGSKDKHTDDEGEPPHQIVISHGQCYHNNLIT